VSNQVRRNLSQILLKARKVPQDQLGLQLRNNKTNKKRVRLMISLSLHLILITKNIWKTMKYDKLWLSLKNVWKKWDKIKIGRKIWLMNGIKPQRKRKLKNDNKTIKLVFTPIDPQLLDSPRHPKLHSRTESQLKREDNKMKSLNGISLLLLNKETNNRLRIESQIKLRLKF